MPGMGSRFMLTQTELSQGQSWQSQGPSFDTTAFASETSTISIAAADYDLKIGTLKIESPTDAVKPILSRT